MMPGRRCGGVIAMLTCMALGASAASGQEATGLPEPTSDNLKAVGFLFGWLDDLGDRVDAIIVKEKYAQLVRSVTRLSKNLMKLEIDVRALDEALASASPDMAAVRSDVADLQETLQDVREDLNGMSLALRQEDRAGGVAAEALIRGRLQARAAVLDELERLARGAPTQERLALLRQNASRGVELVNQAQLASVVLLNKLKRSRPED